MTARAGWANEGIGVPQYVGLRTRLKPGMDAAYENAHATIWAELQLAQRAAGIRRWLIFRHGLDLFHVVECDDFDHAQAELARNPIDRRWQAKMAEYVVPGRGGQGSPPERLSMIYNGDNGACAVEATHGNTRGMR
jgi:L-rhamnose mutarotase